MSELRLAAVDGEQTIPLDFNETAEGLIGLGEAVRSGKLNLEKAIVVAQVDGRVEYTAIGRVTLAEATGLLVLASRQMERDKRDDA